MDGRRDRGPKHTPRNGTLDEILVDWDEFRATRGQLGTAFVRILGYFREDGVKSVVAIEEAMRARDARGLVMPAHTLKSEARQYGAAKLAALARKSVVSGTQVSLRVVPAGRRIL